MITDCLFSRKAVNVWLNKVVVPVVIKVMFFVFSYVWSGFIVLLGIFLNVYSKNEAKINAWVIKHGAKYSTYLSNRRQKRITLTENVWCRILRMVLVVFIRDEFYLSVRTSLKHRAYSSLTSIERRPWSLVWTKHFTAEDTTPPPEVDTCTCMKRPLPISAQDVGHRSLANTFAGNKVGSITSRSSGKTRLKATAQIEPEDSLFCNTVKLRTTFDNPNWNYPSGFELGCEQIVLHFLVENSFLLHLSRWMLCINMIDPANGISRKKIVVF